MNNCYLDLHVLARNISQTPLKPAHSCSSYVKQSSTHHTDTGEAGKPMHFLYVISFRGQKWENVKDESGSFMTKTDSDWERLESVFTADSLHVDALSFLLRFVIR